MRRSAPRQGAPVAWVKMEPLVGLFSIMGITEGCAAPQRRAVVRESYVLSPEGQAVFAANDYLPADPDVPARIAELKPEAGHFAVNLHHAANDPRRTAANGPRSITRYSDES